MDSSANISTCLRQETCYEEESQQRSSLGKTGKYIYFMDAAEDFVNLPGIELFAPLHVSEVACGQLYHQVDIGVFLLGDGQWTV